MKIFSIQKSVLYLVAFGGSLFIPGAFGAAIVGTLQIGNGVVAVNGSPVSGCIDFYNLNPGCGTPGMFTVNAPPDGVFAAALGTSDNVIKDMQQTFPIAKFISLPSINVFFDLPSLTVNPFIAGDCSATATGINQSCSPAGSPFTIVNSTTMDANGKANSATVKLDVNLFGYQGTTADGMTGYRGTFTTQITLVDGGSANIATILAALNKGETLSGNSYSATLSPNGVIPEPGSWVMLLTGIGMLAIGMIAKRRASRV
ncbi:MAG: PEP-CTERM sorting domain-containing protein [Terriglobia bacterium]